MQISTCTFADPARCHVMTVLHRTQTRLKGNVSHAYEPSGQLLSDASDYYKFELKKYLSNGIK